MNFVVVFFSVITVLVHISAFLIESFFWLTPVVHERALSKLGAATEMSYYEQAQILEVLFFNQGFYNLFVSLGGIAGIVLYYVGKTQAGIALVCYVCLFAFGASAVLAFSTPAYSGALVQGVPPVLALLGLYFGTSSRKNT